MGIVDRLRTVIEFATLFWTLKIVLYLPTPCPSARHHSTALQTACLYEYMVKVGSILS